MDIKKNILECIGNTPLVRINKINPNRNVEIWAKVEYFNPGGSIKDRPALYMIEDAERKGELTKDKIILEATSGNTGIGLALVAAVKGYKVLLVMSEAVSEERRKILEALGAEIKLTPAHLGTDGAIEYAYMLARKEPEKYWLVDQFNNDANWMAHYLGTANEIWEQTRGKVDIVVATMGTTGTLMGISKRLKELKPEIQIIGVEPYMGHKIQGLKNMKESYAPGIFDRSLVDRIINIADEEAFEMARILAKEEGLFVGMSSGAAMAAAIKIAKEIKEGNIVVILPDGGERYLSTPLFTTKEKTGIYIYNTLSHKKEEIIPIEKNRIKIYSCGPTLCDYIDLNLCRTLVFADLVRRYLEFKGYEVLYVINVTDFDDRIIKASEENDLSLKELTGFYFDAFKKDLERLMIKEPSFYPKTTENIDEMIKITEILVQKGFAYEKFRSVYFDISRLNDYGKLSHMDLESIEVGKTVDLELYEKENPKDFTLLKRCTLKDLKKGLFFKTKWGNIKPTRHIECASAIIKHMNGRYDLHISSKDLLFPHHENILAIVKAIKGEEAASYWIHTEVVKNGQIKLRKILEKGYSGRHVRYLFLSRHYRKPFEFSWQKLESVKNTVEHLDYFICKLYFYKAEGERKEEKTVEQMIYDLKRDFTKNMENDFNTSGVLASLFRFIRGINKLMDREELPVSKKQDILKSLKQINSVLEIMDLTEPILEEEILRLIREREEARKKKDWDKADSIRKRLKELGIEVIDTRYGTMWRRI